MQKSVRERKEKKLAPLTTKAKNFKINGKKNVGGAAKLSQQIERLVQAVEGKSNITYVARKEMPGSSILEVMEVVKPLFGVEIGGAFWYFTTILFLSKEKREIFATIEDPHHKRDWLNCEFTYQR